MELTFQIPLKVIPSPPSLIPPPDFCKRLTYEINYGGSGNRNKTSGDAIFHCHFYPTSPRACGR